MRSIKEIFIIGHGPSSSHTMGPAFACDYILNKYDDIKNIKVTLYGSLALTGKGHLTNQIIDLKFKDIPHEIIFDTISKVKHPNTMVFVVKNKDNKEYQETILSIGGGTIVTEDKNYLQDKETYPHQHLADILSYCKDNNLSLVDYVKKYENKDIVSYIEDVYLTMKAARDRGVKVDGVLPGSLKVTRKAKRMLERANSLKDGENNIELQMAITSYAVAEENASGGIVVTAPTCGSAGIIPGVITYCKMKKLSHESIINGLLVAGLFGIIAKTNASVSGAECGCQAEVGVACSMGAALLGTALNFNNECIAQCAEIALEHSLGLTCDPVGGYVQIPCIERCAMFSLKAVDAVTLTKLIPSSEAKVSYDDILKTMYLTGKDLRRGYRETAEAGLAKIINK